MSLLCISIKLKNNLRGEEDGKGAGCGSLEVAEEVFFVPFASQHVYVWFRTRLPEELVLVPTVHVAYHNPNE